LPHPSQSSPAYFSSLLNHQQFIIYSFNVF
jgi:hypothetical protein